MSNLTLRSAMRKYETIRFVLEEAGHPLHYTEIAKKFRQRDSIKSRLRIGLKQ